MTQLVREWRELRRFQRLREDEHLIVVYSEDGASWAHLGPIVEQLLVHFEGQICYVSSDSREIQPQPPDQRLKCFYIGDGFVRMWFFLFLRADILLMTMPDLETYHLKRSVVHPVHYVYAFHSLVSTHMIYRPGAFDHFDTILCAGPHHEREIRATESVRLLEPKRLIEHGYGRVDTLLREGGAALAVRKSGPPHVLVAPSWGPQGLIESRGLELAEILLDAGFQVTFRPHPVTMKKWSERLEAVRQKYGGRSGFALDTDISSSESLLRSDVMVSDWSGVALEYAFGLERPVLFVDVPRKVNNPDYEQIRNEPLEVTIRDEIGEVISADRLEDLPEAVRRLAANPQVFRERIRKARRETIYNLGKSGAVGAQAIIDLLP